MSALACPLCHSSEVSVYLDAAEGAFDASAFGSSRKSVSPGRILRCHGCDFGFRQTRANAGTLADVYRRMDTRVYEAELRGRARTARQHLRIVARYARSPGRILDVGCASGLFLACAADAGWEPTGLEPSGALYEKARAALAGRGEVLPEILENARLPMVHFDVITMWDVLEHVPDPLSVMARCRSLLKPGGYLFLNVPDLDSVEARVFRRRWPLFMAEHLNYFNRPSLKLCGERAGLRWVRFGRRWGYFSIEYVLYRLAQHGVPGAALGHRMAHAEFANLLIPVSLGETYGVWRR